MSRWITLFVSIRLAMPIWAQPAILQIRVLDGEGAVYAAGSRATRGVTIQVTDETGKPVEAATVSFRLPEEGPGGTFASGSRTEIVTTTADGRAAVWGMQWNRTLGQFQLRLTAAKGPARAGTTVSLYLSERAAAAPAGSSSGKKWVVFSLVAASVAGAGLAARAAQSRTETAAAAAPALRIGQPSVNLGRP